jgi:hypothetical protein
LFLFATGVIDTGGKFSAGVVDIGGKLPPVWLSTTLAALAVIMCIYVLFSIKFERLIVMLNSLGFNHWSWGINIWNFTEQITEIFYQPHKENSLCVFPIRS